MFAIHARVLFQVLLLTQLNNEKILPNYNGHVFINPACQSYQFNTYAKQLFLDSIPLSPVTDTKDPPSSCTSTKFIITALQPTMTTTYLCGSTVLSFF